MEIRELLNWKTIIAAGVAFATVVLSLKVNNNESANLLSSIFSKSKTALIENKIY